MKYLVLLIACCFAYNVAGAQNPLLPGYYADPSIRQVGDSFYLYVTTDGYPPFGNYGQTMVWSSADLQQWIPQVVQGLPGKTVWAPAMVRGVNKQYYLYYQNSVDYSGYVWVGNTPAGPFKKTGFLGGFDLEPFRDPVSGKVYVISASKELYEMDNDVRSPGYLVKIKRHIPLQGTFTDFTEAPYLFYKDGLYYCMWSGGQCWKQSYKVRYAVSKHIEGPYVEGKYNPVIQTDSSVGISGPGHHSILQADGRYYLVYHRQDLGHTIGCNYRFTCASEITFDAAGEIHLAAYLDTLPALHGHKPKYTNLALHQPLLESAGAGQFTARNAVDGRNDTRWTTEDNEPGILTVDLGKRCEIDAVETDFEYLDKWHTFKIEYADDAVHWHTLADHAQQAVPAYDAMFIPGHFTARYVRLTVLNGEDRKASVWEFKILQRTAE